eukprot:NODE_331_length_10750_cov_0.204676.p1 type:complete len:329 gc:universal NODE_331_length_10750_cov_0.204676:9378-8392(-)
MLKVSGSEFEIQSTNPNARVTGVHDSLLQECEKDIICYRDQYLGKPHLNMIIPKSKKGPMAISVILDGTVYRVLVRSPEGSLRLSTNYEQVPNSFLRKIFGLGPTSYSVVKASTEYVPVELMQLCKDPSLPNELLAMEERQVIRSYKFGLTHLKSNQTVEEEMFGNTEKDNTPAFKEFLSFLGEEIKLKSWGEYKAGLDVQNNMTGDKSLYTKWQGYEIMFHVAAFLPHNIHDRQQIEKKRHIGNDIVTIIFVEPGTHYDVKTNTSKQNHVIAAVTPHPDGYKLSFATRKGVPAFLPELPDPPIIKKDAVGRDFFLHRCNINLFSSHG